jgi:hypothetical protein
LGLDFAYWSWFKVKLLCWLKFTQRLTIVQRIWWLTVLTQ